MSSTDWFGSACVPEDRKRHLCSLLAQSSPGPHAFLLCVPLNQPADGEAKALDVLEQLLGPAVLCNNTVVLFTHTEELDEEERLEEYLLTWRKDLTELVRRCGDRYHTLETQGGSAGMLCSILLSTKLGGNREKNNVYQNSPIKYAVKTYIMKNPLL